MTVTKTSTTSAVDPRTFIPRHIGPTESDVSAMLASLKLDSLDELIDATIPASIRLRRPLAIGAPVPEFEALERLRRMMDRNQVFHSFIGMGYYPTAVPPVVQRN